MRALYLCTKDCLCLYVCPTGAADTEDGIIGASKRVGCGACAQACPSAAISMAPFQYPPRQGKDPSATGLAGALAISKAGVGQYIAYPKNSREKAPPLLQ